MKCRRLLSKALRVCSVFFIPVLVFAFAAGLVACTQATVSPTSTPTKEPAKAPQPTAETKPTSAPVQSPAAAAPAKSLVTVRVGSQSATSDGGIFLAMEKGYFKEAGLDVTFTPFTSAGMDMVASLATDQLDVGGIGVNSALFGSAARDVNIKIVADKGSMTSGHGFEPVVVRKALIDSGEIKSEADFKGRKFAIVAPDRGNAAFILAEKLLARAKLTLKDVNFVLMPFTDMPAGFANGAVDMATALEPTASAIVENGDGRIWADSNEIYPGLQLGVIAYGPSFIARNPQAARDFMVAYLRGARDYIAASDKGVGKAEAVAALIKYTAVKSPAVYDKMIWAGMNPDGYVNTKGLTDDQEFYLREGTIQKRVDINTMVDNQYVDYALQKIGKYKP